MSIVILIGFIIGIFIVIDSQWNIHGISKSINISINKEKGLSLVSKDSETYTYHLEEANVTSFFSGESMTLKNALESGLKIKDLEDGLILEEEDGEKIYKGENYKICIIGEYIVIADLEATTKEIKEALENDKYYVCNYATVYIHGSCNLFSIKKRREN